MIILTCTRVTVVEKFPSSKWTSDQFLENGSLSYLVFFIIINFSLVMLAL